MYFHVFFIQIIALAVKACNNFLKILHLVKDE